jgi:hypothetical protein
MPGPAFDEQSFERLRRQVPRTVSETLGTTRGAFAQAPTIGGISGTLSDVDLLNQRLFGDVSRALANRNVLDPQMVEFARQAAFEPLKGLDPFIRERATQLGDVAASRGLGRSSVSAAMQARALPQILGPAAAQAQGQFAQNILGLRQQGFQEQLQGIGAQSGLLGQRAGIAGQRQGLRESAFSQLMRATHSAQAEREFQTQQKQQGGFLKKLLGGAASAFLGPIAGAAGGAIGGLFGGGGGGGDLGIPGPETFSAVSGTAPRERAHPMRQASQPNLTPAQQVPLIT